MNEEIWICPNCQSENSPASSFCGACGAPKEKEPAPAEQPVAQTTVCPVCGVHISEDADFCGECGARLKKEEPKQKVCRKCKLIFPAEKRFCLRCGEALIEKDSLLRKKSKKDWFSITKQLVLPLIALLFLVFSFLPVFQWDLGESLDVNEKIPVRFSAMDNVIVMFDAAMDDTAEDIQNSRLYEKFEDIMEEIKDREIDPTDEDLRLSRSDKRLLEQFTKISMRLTLRSETTKLTAKYVVSAVVSVLYICFAIVLFIFALITAIRTIKGESVCKTIVQKLLAFSPFAVLITYFVNKNIVFIPTKPALNIVPLIVVIAYIITYTILVLIKEKKMSIKTIVFKSLAVVLSFIMVCSVFGGFFTVGVKGIFKNGSEERTAETTLDISYYLNHEMDEETLEDLVDVSQPEKIKTILSTLPGLFSAKEIREGVADNAISNATLQVALYMFEDVTTVFALLYYLVILLAVFAGIFGSNVLVSMMSCAQQEKNILNYISSAIAAVLTIITFVLNTLFVVSINDQVRIFKMAKDFYCYITATPVILLILSILSFVCIFFFKKRKRNSSLEEYSLYEE
ncbi:MAG: zinc ribbon domain-containing protein [Clostridia bacterium]|nr:zinc ribbon domain-containing protein [Clostridia bacterium]